MNPTSSLGWRCLSSKGFSNTPSNRQERGASIDLNTSTHTHTCVYMPYFMSYATQVTSSFSNLLRLCCRHSLSQTCDTCDAGTAHGAETHMVFILLNHRLHGLRYKQAAQWPLIILIFTLTDERFSWVWPFNLWVFKHVKGAFLWLLTSIMSTLASKRQIRSDSDCKCSFAWSILCF